MYFRQCLRACRKTMFTGSILSGWRSRGSGASTSNLNIALYGRMYHRIGASVPPSDIFPALLSVYIYDIDFASQTERFEREMPQFGSSQFYHWATMLHDVSPCVQTFLSHRNWLLSVVAPNKFCMVIHKERHLATEQMRRYNEPCLEVSAVIWGA